MKKVAFALPLLLAGCLTPHPPPPAAPYLAKGGAPEWSLIIDERNLTFIGGGTAAPVVQPTPQVIVGFAGEIYQTPRIGVNIVHAPCTDAATGRTHPDRVQVTVDQRRFEGCGGESRVAPSLALAGSRWRVVAINGQAVPAAGDYSLSFEARRLSGRFGCNGFGGGYGQSGTTLNPGLIAATRMACAEPAMSFEQQGLAVLSRTTTIGWDGNLLTLSNSAGRIDLSRSS